MLTCTNDRYCPTADTFATLEEFLDYCRDCFGAAPELVERSYRERPNGRPPVRAGWYDVATDELVLVELVEGE